MTVHFKSEALKALAASTTQTVELATELLNNLSIWVVWTGGSGLTATLTIADTCSTDEDIARGTATWTTLPLFDYTTLTYVTSLALSGTSGSHKIQMENYSGKRARVQVTFGAGSCNLFVHNGGSGEG